MMHVAMSHTLASSKVCVYPKRLRRMPSQNRYKICGITAKTTEENVNLYLHTIVSKQYGTQRCHFAPNRKLSLIQKCAAHKEMLVLPKTLGWLSFSPHMSYDLPV